VCFVGLFRARHKSTYADTATMPMVGGVIFWAAGGVGSCRFVLSA
jgi:hypothetical protein